MATILVFFCLFCKLALFGSFKMKFKPNNEITRANLQANKQILQWRPYWSMAFGGLGGWGGMRWSKKQWGRVECSKPSRSFGKEFKREKKNRIGCWKGLSSKGKYLLSLKQSVALRWLSWCVTAHRWLSWLSTGLLRGRSWVQLRPDQHSGSLNNWGESAAFVIISANG